MESLVRQNTNLALSREEAVQRMEYVVMRMQEDSGQKPLPASLVSLRANSYVDHLSGMGVHPADYDRVYKKARQIYNAEEQYSPFNVDFFIKAVYALKEEHRKVNIVTRPDQKKLVKCNVCRGTTFLSKIVDGKIVGLQKNEDGTFKRCECVNESKN